MSTETSTATLKLDEKAPVSTSTGRRFQKHWFLSRKDDLASVTDESYNTALGIVNINMQRPTPKQSKSGILCQVSMETVTGWDYAITVWESREHKGDIMLMLGGARDSGIVNESGKKQYFRDRKLNDAATAQILSYVFKHLKIKE